MPRHKVHTLALHLDTLWRTEGVSEAQSKLLDACISELEYRNRRSAAGDLCTCRMCWGPFPALEDAAVVMGAPASAHDDDDARGAP